MRVRAKSFTTALLCGSVSMMALGTTAFAQTADEDEIIATGVRSSLIRAVEQKRDAIGTVDAVSAEDLGKFPDINLSESLQRIPGVTLNRGNGGEGQAINLRGLGPDFTRVEINGMTGPSNGTIDVFGGALGGGRGFNFEILPSELFSNAAVHKTSRASDSEGGLAGLVRLSTPKPFDRAGFHMTVSAQGNYSDNADNLGKRGAINFSNTFNDTFGISGALVYTDSQFESSRTGGFNVRPLGRVLTAAAAATATPAELAAEVTNIPHYIHDFEDRETISASGAIQFRPSDTVDVLLTGLYSNLDAERIFSRADAPTEGNVTGFSNLTIQDGIVTAGTFQGVQQRLGINDNSQEEDLVQFTASADITPNDNWTISPFLGYTKRDIARVGNLLSMRRNYDPVANGFNGAEVSYRYDGNFVDWSTVGTNFNTNPEEFVLNVFLVRPTQDEDSDLQAKLDFERTFDDSALSAINFGARYSDREIARAGQVDFLIQNTTDRTTLPTLAVASRLVDFNIDGAPASVPSTLLSADGAALFNAFYDASGNPIAGTRNLARPDQEAARTFSVEEKTLNAYAEATFEVDNLTVNTGVRFVSTDQTSIGNSNTNGVIAPITIENSYEEFLPSMSARWSVNENLLVRGSYNKSLTRPNLGDIAPTEIVNGVDESGGTGSQGNPGLQPFTSDNLDFGVEKYFGDEGYVAANVFYKEIDGIIDTGSFTEDRQFPRQADGVLVTAPVVFTRPENGVSASIKGLELAAQIPFANFTEGSFISNLGVTANYTYADSAAEFSGAGDVRNSGLPGLSKNSINTSLYYDDGTFDARIAYAWRDEYLQAFSGAFGVPRFQDAFGQLDISGNWNIMDNLSIQGQILNLTKEQAVYTSSVLRAPNAVTQLDRRFLFGLRYTY